MKMGWVMRRRLLTDPVGVSADELMQACRHIPAREAEQWQKYWTHATLPDVLQGRTPGDKRAPYVSLTGPVLWPR